MLFVNIGVKSFLEDRTLHTGGKIFPPVYCLLFCQLLPQANANLNPLNESRLFMISAEGTDGIDNLIDFLQGFIVHESVEFLEVSFDGCIIEAAGFVIGIEQHLQDALRIIRIVWLLGGQMSLEGSHKLIHLHHQRM